MLAGVGIGLTIALEKVETQILRTDYLIWQLSSANKQFWLKTLS
jgi:hypothetical protein